MNYRESLLDWEDRDGDTHTLSAFKVKYLRGNKICTRVVADIDGRQIEFVVQRPHQDVRAELQQALAAGE